MIIRESDCCDCGLPCIGFSCKYFETIRCVCDNCQSDMEDLYWWEDEQLCIDCIIEQLEKVEIYE